MQKETIEKVLSLTEEMNAAKYHKEEFRKRFGMDRGITRPQNFILIVSDGDRFTMELQEKYLSMFPIELVEAYLLYIDKFIAKKEAELSAL